MPKEKSLMPQSGIENKIFLIRGKKVMLDRDLAELYGVKAIRLREQVKRNIGRFPEEFMFQLIKEEVKILVSQNAIPSLKYLGGYLPYAFTEYGVVMLSSVLKSKRAIQVNIQIVKTFVRLREMIVSNKILRERINEMEERYDKQFKVIFEAIKRLLEEKIEPKKKIGFLK